MTKYLEMNTKSLLTNPSLIFWSILFIEFWVFMWAYVFGGNSGIPPMEEAVRAYTAMGYGNLLMLSLSGACTTIANSLLYSSRSVRFITKYTKLSPSRFLLENLLSSLAVLLTISGIMFTSVFLVFSSKFGMFLIPANPGGLVFGTFIGTLFIYALSLFLNFIIVVIRAPKSASFLVSFLSLILGYTAYMALWVDFGAASYILPFNCIVSVCYYFFTGRSPPTGDFFGQHKGILVDVNMALASLLAWAAMLIILDTVLLKKMRGIGVEEMRIT
jgi:hypothetical protein